MISYLTIILTSILALIGLVGKTSKNTDGKHFQSLTPFGVVMLVLLLLSLGLGMWVQHDSTVENDKIKAETRSKTIQDSLVFLKKSIEDSLRYLVTIESFKKQRELDLQQLNVDSSHFEVTINKFGEQLKQQQTTLNSIYSLSNPLFPIYIKINLKIKIDKDRKELKGFDNAMQGWFQGKKNRIPKDIAFSPDDERKTYKSFLRYKHDIKYLDPFLRKMR